MINNILKVEVNVVTLKYQSLDEQYEKLVEFLDADVLDYNDDIAILLDEVGFEKPNNPIYTLTTEDGFSFQLAVCSECL